MCFALPPQHWRWASGKAVLGRPTNFDNSRGGQKKSTPNFNVPIQVRPSQVLPFEYSVDKWHIQSLLPPIGHSFYNT
jgi:hypothetical protein